MLRHWHQVGEGVEPQPTFEAFVVSFQRLLSSVFRSLSHWFGFGGDVFLWKAFDSFFESWFTGAGSWVRVAVFFFFSACSIWFQFVFVPLLFTDGKVC